MKIAVFDTHAFDREFFTCVNSDYHHVLTFLEPRLTPQTATLAKGHPCVCCFVNDHLDAETLSRLKEYGVKLVALRSAGYNQVDLLTAAKLGLRIVRVPAYSPHAVAEYAVTLLLGLDRKIHRAFERVRELNFSLDGLMGFDLFEKTVGIVGTGKIGRAMARIMSGFGCKVLAYDPKPDAALVASGVLKYVPLAELYEMSDVISLHVPLLLETRHMIDARAISGMKKGVYLINTGRGALIDTPALISALKSGHIGAAGLDVYEEEEGVFYENLSDQVLQDDILARLLTFPNVLVTSHQAFLTREALIGIATTTLANVTAFETSQPLENEVRAETHLFRSSSPEILPHA